MEYDINFLLNRAFAEGSTQSEMTTMDNCGQLWWWRYAMMLKMRGGFSWALTYGSACHQAWEEMYATQGKRWSVPDLNTFLPPGTSLTLQQQKDKEYWQGVLRIQLECYFAYYKEDFEIFKTERVEQIADIYFEFEGQRIRLKGMLDLIVCNVANKGRWLFDHKTTRDLQLKTVLGWDFRFQFMFYLWLSHKIDEAAGNDDKFRGYYINAMKKPTITVRKNDTLDMFFERLRNEMLMEPEKYYYRQSLLLNKGSIAYFEEKVLGPKLKRINLLTNPEISDSIKLSIVNNMNTDHCQRYGMCEFLPLCQHGFDLEGFRYEERSAKHEELEAEAE
jgi:hypothetical protein